MTENHNGQITTQRISIYGQPVVVVADEAECQNCGFSIQRIRTNWYRMDDHCKSHYRDQILRSNG